MRPLLTGSSPNRVNQAFKYARDIKLAHKGAHSPPSTPSRTACTPNRSSSRPPCLEIVATEDHCGQLSRPRENSRVQEPALRNIGSDSTLHCGGGACSSMLKLLHLKHAQVVRSILLLKVEHKKAWRYIQNTPNHSAASKDTNLASATYLTNSA